MSDFAELAGRLAALEERVGQGEGLRASQDRDLSDLAATYRAQHHTLQALALTASEYHMSLSEIRRDIAQIRAGMATLADGMARVVDSYVASRTSLRPVDLA